MAVIWQRKRNLIIAIIVGIVIAVIPMGLMLGVMTVNYKTCKDKLDTLSKGESGKEKIITYVMNKSKQKGDSISESDLIEYELYGDKNISKTLQKSDLLGKVLKIDVNEGTVLCENMICDKDVIPNNLRKQIFNDIELNSEILEGSVVDIRIAFPNGEDYIIAENKKIIKRVDDSILINVSEEEILKISSSRVDKKTYEGTIVYAIMYVSDYQEPGISDYPVNAMVIELGNWDPNILDKVFDEDTLNKRNVLESNMLQFMS